MQVAEHIFKSYDIRGAYPGEVNAEVAYAIANQYVGLLGGAGNVLVVHDARTSGPELAQAVSQGLQDAGATAIFAGLGPTDLFYYGCAMFDCPGIMVTASHNPPDQNGFKIVRKMPYALSYDEGISELRRRVQLEPPVRKEGGRQERAELEGGFVDFMTRTVGHFDMPHPAVVDTGNGASGPLMLKLIPAMKLNCEVIFAEPDGRFPNRGPDPMKVENLRHLAARVRETGASIGVAVDGDGDRAVVVDGDGEPLAGDFMAALLSRNALERLPGAPVLYDVRCSRVVPDTIRQFGGTPLVSRVGHVYMKKRMTDEGAAFAGELSGHYYFPEFFGADSGLLATLYMMRMAAALGDGWGRELLELRQKYHMSGEINFRVVDAPQRIESLKQIYPGATLSSIDGVTFDLDDWWFNVRMSNTEPLLRLNLEAPTPEELKRRVDEVSQVLSHS